MGEPKTSEILGPPWKGLAIIGSILVAQTFTDIGWEGPWNDVSFTQGFIGLIGGVLLYLSWFRWQFKINGLIPTLERWKNPEKGLKILFTFSIMMIVFTWLVGEPFSEYFPRPSGMILGLISLLMLLQACYVWLVIRGFLKGEEE